MIAGTIRNAVNQMQLVNDWEQKKATGDVVKKQEGMTVTSQEESMIQHFREQLERDKESSAYSQIYNKIASGQELTASEEDAIRQKDPKAYMEYKAARMEQEAYERRLERCKTKEEAQRLQVNEMNGNLAELKSIVNNPNIPKSEKLKEAQRIMGNTFRAVESFTRFVKSTEYRDLPTEEEIVETVSFKVLFILHDFVKFIFIPPFHFFLHFWKLCVMHAWIILAIFILDTVIECTTDELHCTVDRLICLSIL